jgi:hypothetical protein
MKTTTAMRMKKKKDQHQDKARNEKHLQLLPSHPKSLSWLQNRKLPKLP